MRYLILGTTEARDEDGDPLPLGGPRIRALLAALALRAARPGPTPVDVLIDEVWAADPPYDAPAALQALVGRLRRAIGREAVVSSPGGYHLATAAPGDDVDLLRFERLTDAGMRALDAGDPHTAATTLRQALALWRGPALADLPERDAAAARAEALRLAALHRRIDADLARDRPAGLVPELRELVADHPFDETFHAQLIRALRAAGHSADALAAYEEVRTLLADRLGTDPGPELRELHRQLLLGEPTPPPAPPAAGRSRDGAGHRGPGGDRHPDADGPRASDGDGDPGREGYAKGDADRAPGRDGARAPGRGRVLDGDRYRYEDGARDRHPDGDRYGARDGDGDGDPGRDRGRRPDDDRGRASVPGARPAAFVAPPGNLRARLTSFVGRRSEIGALRKDLDGTRLVTLTGAGGSGKTRLSVETAATLTDAYPDGIWVVELASLDDPSAVPGAVLSAIGRRETTMFASGLEGRTSGADAVDPAGRLVEYCADRRLLLLLDNCEHVIDTAARLTETLLARCPGVTVLATSREPLGVPGETVRPVEPLPPAPAHQLFAERAATVRPGFDPAGDPDTAAAVAEICRRLDGLPLAIELAAARLRLLTPRQIADRLDDRFHLLTSGNRTALPRQQTLRAVVDWSWDLLDERERTVLRRASVFAGGWSLAAAEAVCAETGCGDATEHESLRAGACAPAHTPAHSGVPIAPPEVLDLLGALADKSLLVVDHPPGEARYRMLETIHEYVSERAAEDSAARADHAAATARHIAHFRDFARAAEPRLRSAEQLPWLRRVEADLDNIRAALHRSLTARDENTSFAIILAMGWLWWLRNYRDEGATWARRALDLTMNPNDAQDDAQDDARGDARDGERNGERNDERNDERDGERDGGRPALDMPPPAPDGADGDDPAATRYWHAMDLRLLRFFLLIDAGHGPDGQDPETRLIARLTRDAYGSHPGPRSARFPGLLWPFAGYILDGHTAMIPLMDKAVANCRENGDDWAVGAALMFRAHLAIDTSSGIERAEADYAEVRELSARVGDRWMLAQVESARAEMAALRGRFGEARAAFEEARRLAREIGAHTEVPFFITRLADLALNSGDPEGAAKLLDHSEQEAERWGAVDVRAFNRLLRAHIELLHGDPAKARAYCEDSRRQAARSSPPQLFWVVVQGLEGRVGAEEGDPWGGVRMLRDALGLGLEVGCTEALLADQAESAAYILVRLGHERPAVRLLGAADGWRGRLPRIPLALAETRETEARAGAALGPAVAGKLRAEATALTTEEAIALLDEVLAGSGSDTAR
ncbi:BTAD domain-containing putative transcriptional regulator [Streptomyces sp. NBRC 110028]|uniref:AfsR/SARP family transcriptional regulator n=1 Tax=Streptomyces sp. NBRC 110028 TaxID=1621260 RepID=UPI000A83F4CF|nr:BTAD domain-containing putative transcriptional regulator [Streptomyces sp. NBRC 110028]